MPAWPDRPALPVADPHHPSEVRASAAVPLPHLRSIPDFVGMPNGEQAAADDAPFWVAQAAALGWALVAVVVTFLIGGGVASVLTWPYALALFLGLVWLPAYLSAFRYTALFLDDSPALTVVRPATPVTVVVSGSTAPASTLATLGYLAGQDYAGPFRVILVGGNLADADVHAVQRAAADLGLGLDVLRAGWLGSAAACNLAVPHVTTTLVLSLHAGACLHPSAVRLLVARLESSPPDTAAVSGQAFVRNRLPGDRAEVRAAGYAVDVDATQRIESLFRGACVAEPACMLFQVSAVRAIGGLPDGGASEVTAAWRFLARGWRVVHEPHAIAFTTEPITVGSAGRARARADRGVIAGRREARAHRPGRASTRFLTALARSGRVRDAAFLVAAVHAVALIGLGHAELVVAYLALVAPVVLAAAASARRHQREVLDEAGLVTPHPRAASVVALLAQQVVQAPAAIGEALHRRPVGQAPAVRQLTPGRLPGRGPRYA
jgi:poly-beta-1,6-N-acetyl-D-glucosamine synthase